MNQSLTATESAALGATFGAIIGAISIFSIIFFILYVIASWKIFKKAGEPGWKAIIPIYNVYIMFKIVNMKSWFWWLVILSIIGPIVAALNNSTAFYYMSGIEAQTVNIATIPAAVLIFMVVESIVAIWAGILYAWRTSKVFGHGIGYTIGLILLPNIFWLILGFGKSKYNKNALSK